MFVASTVLVPGASATAQSIETTATTTPPGVFVLAQPPSAQSVAQQEADRQRRAADRRQRVTYVGLLASGLGLFAGSWLLGWATTSVWSFASVSCSTGPVPPFGLAPSVTCTPPRGPYFEGYWQMAIPLVGPWLTFVGDDTFRGNDIAFPVIVGVLEPIGLVLFIAGLVVGEPSRDSTHVRVGPGSIVVAGSF